MSRRSQGGTSTQREPMLPTPFCDGPEMTDEECDLFRRYVEEHCAIALGSEKKYLFESRLARLMAQCGVADYRSFYELVRRRDDLGLRDRIVEAIVTNETLWFRDVHPFIALREQILPELARRAKEQRRRVRIWSAGCSTGQEPYSVAMLVDELCLDGRLGICFPQDFEIIATDISDQALTLARAGRYDPVSMRRGMVPAFAVLRDRCFVTEGRTAVLTEDVRQRVTFARLNLQDDFRHLGQFDLILLRYVGIYFSRPFRRTLLGRLIQRLTPEGRILFGAAEGLVENDHGLVPEKVGESHFYHLRRAT